MNTGRPMTVLNGGMNGPQILAIKKLNLVRIVWQERVFTCRYSFITHSDFTQPDGSHLKTVTDLDEITGRIVREQIIRDTIAQRDKLLSKLAAKQATLDLRIEQAQTEWERAKAVQAALRKKCRKFKRTLELASEMGERFKAIVFGQPDKFAQVHELADQFESDARVAIEAVL